MHIIAKHGDKGTYFWFMKTPVKYCFLYYLNARISITFLACINFDFLESVFFFKFTFQIINTYTKMTFFLVAWLNADALIIAWDLSVQTVPELRIYKRIIYNALQIVRIIHHRLCVYFLFELIYHSSLMQ